MTAPATRLVPAGHPGGHETDTRPTALVAVLAVTQTIGYGTL